MAALDLWHIGNWSLRLDAVIVAKAALLALFDKTARGSRPAPP